MRNSFLSLSLLLLCCLSGAAQNRVQNYIDRQLKTDTLFTNAIVGILAVGPDGREIAEWNADLPLLPASTMKTVTAGLAFEVLGADYRFSTRVAHDGHIEDGVLHGNLYIVGGADPTLGSLDTIAYPLDSIFGIWAQAVKKAGIRRIDGSVVGDDRIFAEESIHPNWVFDDIGWDYGSGASGLSFCENLTYFDIAPGAAVGDPVRITPAGPQAPYITYRNEAVTGPWGTGDKLVYHASALAPVGRMTGTFGIDSAPLTVGMSNKFGPAACAAEFALFLQETGVYSKGATDVRHMASSYFVPAQEDMKVLVETFSPELGLIVEEMLAISNNFYAETIFKMVGRELVEENQDEPCGEITYDMARDAAKAFLQGQGVSTRGYIQDDGSGLSREDCLSPRFLTRFYGWMAMRPDFQTYLDCFPGPGRRGTLQYVLPKADPALKRAIHAKSGSLSGVRCYAGYVDSPDGPLRFAIMVNHYDCPTRKVQPKIEGFMEELARYAASL